MPDLTFTVGTTAEELADNLPWVGNFVLVALERHDEAENGRVWAGHLAEIARRAEAYFERWERERTREAAKAPST